MDIQEARSILGDRLLCQDRLAKLVWPFAFAAAEIPAIPFSRATLQQQSGTHILIHTPKHDAQGARIDLLYLREAFGIDPDRMQPCFYNQDWYVREAFAMSGLDGGWHLVAGEVLEERRAEDPSQIESGLPAAQAFPAAVTCAFTFFAWWLASGGKKLWQYDFSWCRDRDDNNDRIYVGRYDDPKGLSKSGFSVHRHLALRPAYSVAPEWLRDDS
jgi:hypothetical protein